MAAGQHLVVGHRGHDHLRAVEVQVAVDPGRDRLLGDGDESFVHVDQAVLVVPRVAPQALGVLGHLVARSRRELEVAPALPLDARTPRSVVRGQPRLPHVGGLDHVVVHADDLGQLLHRCDRTKI